MGNCFSTDHFNCCDPNVELNQVGKIQPFCLSIPHVLQKILEHFSHQELLQLSLVSKQWNYEARVLLAKRDSLLANLSPYSPKMGTTFACPRSNLSALAADLRKMNAAPPSFRGIHVNIGFSKSSPGSNTSSGQLDPAYAVILDRIKWKNLSFTVGGEWEDNKNCQEFLLVKNILVGKCEDLLEIAFGAETNLGEALFQEFFHHCSFPRLKVLKILCYRMRFEPNFCRALVSRAPNLEKLYAPALTWNLLEGSSAVIVPTIEFNPLHDFCLSLLNAIRPERLALIPTCHDFKTKELQRFYDIFPLVLRNSWNTLKQLRMELFFALPLMNCGISFVNVRNLIIFIPEEYYRSPLSAVLESAKAFDLTHIFPNLTQVRITFGHTYDMSADDITEFGQRGRSLLLTELKVTQAVNIKHLHLTCFSADIKVEFFAQMFPNVQTLSVHCYEAKIPYSLIWKHWVHLKKLEFEKVLAPTKNTESLDSVFCGIHPEEVAELSEKDDEYLEAVHIVPVMPAVTCMKELRVLDLNYGRPTEWPLLLSKVTYLIAFKRCPLLSVTMR